MVLVTAPTNNETMEYWGLPSARSMAVKTVPTKTKGKPMMIILP